MTKRKSERLSLKAVFGYGFLVSVIVVAGLSYLLWAYDQTSFEPWHVIPRTSQERWFEIVRNAVTVAAALGVGVTLFFSYRKQETAEQNQATASEAQKVAAEAQRTAAEAQRIAADALALSTKQYELEMSRERRASYAELHRRFAEAAGQLAGERMTTRVAGIHGMAAVADEWAGEGNFRQLQSCLSTLGHTFRSLEAEWQEGGQDPDISMVRGQIWRTILERLDTGSDGRWPEGVISLQSSILQTSVLSNLTIDLELDLSRCTLSGASHLLIEDCIISQGGILRLAYLNLDEVGFRNCKFQYGCLDLTWTSVAKRILFLKCDFSGTSVMLHGAAGTGNIEFVKSTFDLFPDTNGALDHSKTTKFVDCIVRTEVIYDNPHGGWAFGHRRVSRGNEYASEVPRIQAREPGPYGIHASLRSNSE